MNLSIAGLVEAYASGTVTPREALEQVAEAIRLGSDHCAWIHLLDEAALGTYLDRLATLDPAEHPLWGVPFAIKDNIDLANCPTTAACPAYSYVPAASATVVDRLLAAGAVPVGKTNLDQFATGLVGTRSPYGAMRNAIDPDFISGGSSGGSAVAVKLGMCSLPSVPIPRGPGGFPPRSMDWSASSRRSAGGRRGAWCPPAVPSTACRFSRAPPRTRAVAGVARDALFAE